MDELGIVHIQQDKQFRAAQGIAWLNIAMGLNRTIRHKPVAMLSMLEYISTAVMSNERNDPKAATWVYLTHLNRCKAMDSYHRALIYILTAVPALRNNIDACFNFEKDEIKPESLAAGWQTSGTTKLTRFAYNLWNGYDDKSCTPYDLFDCSFAPYMYEAVKLRYPEYTRQLDDVVIDDARN